MMTKNLIVAYKAILLLRHKLIVFFISCLSITGLNTVYAADALYMVAIPASVIQDQYIRRIDLNTNVMTDAFTLDFPARFSGMAIDEPNGKIYWSQTKYAQNDCSVWKANLDGTNREQIVVGQVGAGVIAVDSVNGKVYINGNSGGCGGSGPADGYWVHRFNLDGTNIEPVPVRNDQWYGIAPNPDTGKLYFASGSSYFKDILRSNLDGTGPEVLISRNDLVDGEFVVNTARQIDIDFNNTIYWINAVHDSIWRADSDGNNYEMIVDITDTTKYKYVAAWGVQVDNVAGKLYWHRHPRPLDNSFLPTEVWRSDLDGNNKELVVKTVRTDIIASYLALVQTEIIPEDEDGDGVIGDKDKCPLEDASGYDFDQDGCIDNSAETAELIIIEIENLSLSGVLSNSDTNKLLNVMEDAAKLIELGNLEAATDKLNNFKKKIRRLVIKGKLTEEQGDFYLNAADATLAVLYP